MNGFDFGTRSYQDIDPTQSAIFHSADRVLDHLTLRVARGEITKLAPDHERLLAALRELTADWTFLQCIACADPESTRLAPDKLDDLRIKMGKPRQEALRYCLLRRALEIERGPLPDEVPVDKLLLRLSGEDETDLFVLKNVPSLPTRWYTLAQMYLYFGMKTSSEVSRGSTEFNQARDLYLIRRDVTLRDLNAGNSKYLYKPATLEEKLLDLHYKQDKSVETLVAENSLISEALVEAALILGPSEVPKLNLIPVPVTSLPAAPPAERVSKDLYADLGAPVEIGEEPHEALKQPSTGKAGVETVLDYLRHSGGLDQLNLGALRKAVGSPSIRDLLIALSGLDDERLAAFEKD